MHPFLKDVFLLSVSAFGGPNAHIAMMLDTLVAKKKYLTEEELIELNALCQVLPGPTSTQTLTAIAYKMGGVRMALIALAIWVSPAVILMSGLSFLLGWFKSNQIEIDFLEFVQPLAVSFIAVAAVKLGQKTIKSSLTLFILAGSALCAYFVQWPYIYPILIIAGGAISYFADQSVSVKKTDNSVKIRPPWPYLVAFVTIFGIAIAATSISDNKQIALFEQFYRYGSLIFGGGQVLIPMIYKELVEFLRWVNSEEFLSGYSIVQALPGPVFSFSAFIGGMSTNDSGHLLQMASCLMAAIGIFLPGALLIFFVYPVWDQLKQKTWLSKALKGLNAAASGLVVAAVVLLFQAAGITLINGLVVILGFGLIWFTKVPSPFWVLIALAAGFAF